MHPQLRTTRRRRKSQLRRTQSLPGRQHPSAHPEVLPPETNILPRLHPIIETDPPIGFPLRILLHHHRIGPCWHGGPRQNASTLPGLQRSICHPTRSHLQSARQHHPRTRYLPCSHRIAIHRSRIKAGQIDQSGDILCQTASQRFR